MVLEALVSNFDGKFNITEFVSSEGCFFTKTRNQRGQFEPRIRLQGLTTLIRMDRLLNHPIEVRRNILAEIIEGKASK